MIHYFQNSVSRGGHPLTTERDGKNWEKHEAIIEKFIQVIAKNMDLYDITPSTGRLYGVLYFNDEPMTLDDMRDALHMSKTSMSTGVRTLSEMRMVETAFRKGIRKDLYQSEEDWYKSFTSLFGKRWRSQTESNIDETMEAIEILEEMYKETNDEELKKKIEHDLEKLEYAKKYYQWLMQFIKVIDSGEIFNYIPKNK